MHKSLTLTPQFPTPFHRRLSIKSAVSEARPIKSSSTDTMHRSLYEVLRVKKNASQTEIKTAYRTLAKLYHPDANSRFLESSIAKSSDGHDFIEIHNAYSTLSDPNARAVYDENLGVGSVRVSGFRSSGRGRGCPTRRWETDQCW